MKRLHFLLSIALTSLMGFQANAVFAASGKDIVNTNCAGCHATGVLNAPKIGNKDDWKPRLKQGKKSLIDHALKGFKAMPPKGGNASLSDADIKAAVEYLISSASESKSAEAKKKPVATAKKAPKQAPKRAKKSKSSSKRVKPGKANKFNRLMLTQAERNLPPPEDGIHDQENEDAYNLQPPREAFDEMPSARYGNYVDWVKALNDGAISPRYDRLDPNVVPVVMDLNIVREVKGSMPNVVYPHKQHTQWLD